MSKAGQRKPVKPAIPQRRSLGQAIREQLLETIRAGELRPGDRVPTERELMHAYGVGRNTVREAVQSLVAIGVLDVRPGRGATVLALPSDTALDLGLASALLHDDAIVDFYDLRLILESEIAARAAARATEEDVAEVAAAFEHYRSAYARRRRVHEADMAFHQTIAARSGNPLFVKILSSATDALSELRRVTAEVPGANDLALSEHERIRDAIASRDAQAARAAMAAHIHSAIWALERAREHERGAR